MKPPPILIKRPINNNVTQEKKSEGQVLTIRSRPASVKGIVGAKLVKAPPVEVETNPFSQLIEQLQKINKDLQDENDCIIADRMIPNPKCLPGICNTTLDFANKVLEIANIKPKYAPDNFYVSELKRKHLELKNIMELNEVSQQFIEIVVTACFLRSDDCYNDARIYYDSLRKEVKRMEDSEEVMLFNELQPFFKSHKKKPSPRKPSKPVNEKQSSLSGEI
jgi:hypothetical protein